MASSAALLQGLSFNTGHHGDRTTFDDSDAGHGRPRTYNKDDDRRAHDGQGTGGVGMTTVGGITLGSIATSFDADDEDERRLYDEQLHQVQSSKPAPMAWYKPAAGHPRLGALDDDSSLLDEQHEALAGDQESVVHAMPSARTAEGARYRQVSSRTGSRSATGSSRLASASTAPTTEYDDADVVGYGEARRAGRDGLAKRDVAATGRSSPRGKKVMPSGLQQDWSQRKDDSTDTGLQDDSRVLRDLNVDDSRDSARYDGRQYGTKALKKSPGGVGQNMTLREQEKVIDEVKKENFDLKLKIHFYEQRLERLAPEQIDQALRENIQLKVEFQTLRTELKRYKKLLLEGNRAIEQLSSERDQALRGRGSGGGKREREVEKELEREREDKEALEARLREQALELRELRESRRRGFGSHPDEEAEDEFERLQAELDAIRDAHDEALGDQDDLRHQLRDTQDALEEARDEIARLSEERAENQSSVVGREETSVSGTIASRREHERLQARLDELERENDALREDLARADSELDHRDRARGGRESSDASQTKTREQLEDENDEFRDRASAHALQVERLENELADKEREIEELLGELDRKDADHVIALRQLEDEIKGEMEDARTREADARDLLDEKELDIEGLAAKVETLVVELGDKDQEMAGDKEEIEALTHDLQKLGAQIFALEEEADEKDNRIQQLTSDLEAADRELEVKLQAHDRNTASVRDQLAKARAALDEYAMRTADLEEKSRADTDTKQKLEQEAVDIMKALKKEEEEHERHRRESSQRRSEDEARWRKLLEERTRDLERAQSDIERFKDLVGIREKDVQGLQQALNGLEKSARHDGETHSNNRLALEIELDRLKRDLARCENDLERAEASLQESTEALRERDLTVATLQSENKELSGQLAAQTQTRLALTDKYDEAVKNLRAAQEDLATTRERLRNAESKLSTDQRTSGRSEHQFRDQLTERNSLLQNVHQQLERMSLSQRRPGQAEPLPHNNFGAFQDSLLSRVKSVTQLQADFEQRTRDVESKLASDYNTIKRQHEAKVKQLDKLESTIKSANESQKQWRERVRTKQVEVDSGKSVIADLQRQIAALRSSPNDDAAVSSRIAALSSRASNAERKLHLTQAQLSDAEAKLAEARDKVGVAEGKWEARLQELQSRLRAAEEKLKRERQGAKERVHELIEQNTLLKDQIVDSRRRGDQLDDVLTGAHDGVGLAQ
ncbi:hypothetical protein OIV83_006358 [Microbotryomycetes sp. JL201]|nr:hypothetical protein OIV83_006358 [Microbotryomycetes sp. JL201]